MKRKFPAWCLIFFVAIISSRAQVLIDNPSMVYRENIYRMLEFPEDFAADKGLQSLKEDDFEGFTNTVQNLKQAKSPALEGLPYLHMAIALGNEDIATYLLDLGVDPNESAPVETDEPAAVLTALHVALLVNHPHMAKLLLQRGADPNLKALGVIPSAFLAAGVGSTNLLEMLLAHGADIHAHFLNSSPLHVAAVRNDEAVTDWLLQHGADANAATDSGVTALHIAADEDHINIARMLIEKGADVNKQSRNGATPLMRAALYNGVSVAEVLLEHGCLVNLLDQWGRTAAACAAAAGNVEMLDLLADHGADLLALNDTGHTLVHFAGESDQSNAVAWCARRGLDLNVRTPFGTTALYQSILDDATNSFDALLSLGADSSIGITNGWTPVHSAARKPNDYFIRRLLETGADMEQRGPRGETPLITAVQAGVTNVVLLLLDAGANIEATNDYKFNALDFALAEKNPAMFRLLLDRGASPNARGSSNDWPVIMSVAWAGNEEMLRDLLEYGADPNLTPPSGQSALFVALRRGHNNIMHTLLKAGADPGQRLVDGMSPWHLAVIRGLTNEAALLASYMTPEELAPTNRVRVFFDLDAPMAKTVSVVGVFNEWDPTAHPLTRREDDGWWYIELDFFPQNYTYKFYVDGGWITDPLNPRISMDTNLRTDNSVTHATNRLASCRPQRAPSRADALRMVEFVYHDRGARSVAVAGEFNGWNTSALPMAPRQAGIWSVSTQLAPGTYGYKFIVDGQWIMDPSNTLTKVVGDVSNSMLVVESEPAF
ncbi:MAG: ankyrin repeat domain-containing protein [Kiritimatiellia bacterium]